jgi:CubicO group peptidase (beta-lactamase class C family)
VQEVLDGRAMARRLERQPQSADPRAALCYHALTYGWLAGELVRRVDGRSVGRFVQDEIAGRLDLELWIGLPAALERRVATLELAADYPSRPHRQPAALACDPLLRSLWANPPLLTHDSFPWNERAFHAAEIPAANGIGSARSLARLYANLDRLLAPDTLRLARTPLAEGRDEANQEDVRFGVGFALQTAARPFGPVAEAFGHGGAGGSLHGAWPRHGIGFSYAMNRLRDDADPDPRPHALLAALAEVL